MELENVRYTCGHCSDLMLMTDANLATTIKIVSGALQPTSGSVLVNGYDISQHTEEIRRRMGVCDQSDVLFESLTPAEHLRMFGLLKGVPEERIEQEIDEKLEGVLLTEHRDKEVSELSGGMKRKLCTAIAFLGEPLIVFLDECTAGLDPRTLHLRPPTAEIIFLNNRIFWVACRFAVEDMGIASKI
jgi:ABC-type Na+ transport system ATPase subunit NatA